MISVSEIWAAGDYPAVAQHIASVGEAVVRFAGIAPGERVLDVACGAGNATIPAARAGAIATGLDITPELLDAARDLAPDVQWVEGDAEALPFGDDSFDVVLSTFGCMFAPDHQTAADELVRVGGRVAVASWTPEGTIGDFFRTIARHAPPPPGDSPLLWGTEAHVRELFAGRELAFERSAVTFEFESAASAADFYFDRFGPIIAARARAEDEDALRADLRALFVEFGADEGPYESEYLMALVT
jgi:SAM-dependent methyltransferase